jgi:hypothetical protein
MMGEAKRKAAARTAVVPDELRTDIERVVRSIVFPPGGMCWFRMIAGRFVLRDLAGRIPTRH